MEQLTKKDYLVRVNLKSGKHAKLLISATDEIDAIAIFYNNLRYRTTFKSWFNGYIKIEHDSIESVHCSD